MSVTAAACRSDVGSSLALSVAAADDLPSDGERVPLVARDSGLNDSRRGLPNQRPLVVSGVSVGDAVQRAALVAVDTGDESELDSLVAWPKCFTYRTLC